MAFGLQTLLQLPITKKASTQKTDLELLFSSAPSSPEKPEVKIDYSNMFANYTVEAPRKKLTCPKRLESPKAKDLKPKDAGAFLYDKVSFTSKEPITIPDQPHCFVFASTENAADALESFKEICPKVANGVVSCGSLSLSFRGGVVKAKTISGPLKKQLMEKESCYPLISMETALATLDELTRKNKLRIYSSELFHFATVVPAKIAHEQFKSCKGLRHRATVTGCIFPEAVIAVQGQNSAEKHLLCSTQLLV